MVKDIAGVRLQVKKMVEEALAKHGLKSASQRAKMKEQLYEEMQDVIDGQVCLVVYFLPPFSAVAHSVS